MFVEFLLHARYLVRWCKKKVRREGMGSLEHHVNTMSYLLYVSWLCYHEINFQFTDVDLNSERLKIWVENTSDRGKFWFQEYVVLFSAVFLRRDGYTSVFKEHVICYMSAFWRFFRAAKERCFGAILAIFSILLSPQ